MINITKENYNHPKPLYTYIIYNIIGDKECLKKASKKGEWKRMINIKRLTNDKKNWDAKTKKENGIQKAVKRIGLDKGIRPFKYGKKRKQIVELVLGLKSMKIDDIKRPFWYGPGYVEQRFTLTLLVAINGEKEVKQELGITGFSDEILQDVKFVKKNIEKYSIEEYREKEEEKYLKQK